MFVYWNNSGLNPYWNSHLKQNWNIHEYSKFIHVPGISGKQGCYITTSWRKVCRLFGRKSIFKNCLMFSYIKLYVLPMTFLHAVLFSFFLLVLGIGCSYDCGTPWTLCLNFLKATNQSFLVKKVDTLTWMMFEYSKNHWLEIIRVRILIRSNMVNSWK